MVVFMVLHINVCMFQFFNKLYFVFSRFWDLNLKFYMLLN